MNEQQDNTLPVWFWVIASVTLVWNLMGVMAFISTVSMTPETLAELPAEQAALYQSTPVWANIAFAVAVIGGALGCVGLLLRKNWAKILFIASLAGVIVQMVHAFFISNSIEVFGPGGMIMPIMVIIVAIGLVWFADVSTKRNWIR